MHESMLISPKITVCVVSYNQENFIRKCLNSILLQVCTYEVEVLISDDCSTDRTPLIIEEFEKKYANIRLLKRNKNIGALENFKQIHEAATGDFICHCDGDDYWLPGKLQKQADFLINNPECNIVWTRMLIRNETLNQEKEDLLTKEITQKKFYQKDIIQFVAIGLHSSKMYRNMELIYPDFPIIDYFVNVQHVQDGYATFVSDEIFGVYRVGIGIASVSNNTKILTSKTLSYYNSLYIDGCVSVSTCALYFTIVELKNRRYKNAIMYMNNISKRHILQSVKNIIKQWGVFKSFRFPKFIK